MYPIKWMFFMDSLDFYGKSAYNHNDFTAMMPQQYSERHTPREGPAC